jgi:hypothetical protein
MSIKIFFSKIHARIKHAIKTLKTYAGLDDLIAIVILLIGVSYYFLPFPTQFLEDTHAEFIGMGLTVLVIANATEYQQTKAEKKRLILQLGSPENGFAIEALRQLRQRGWIEDGSLAGADISEANLTDADLTKAYLSRVNFCIADLSAANLSGANLTWADLSFADIHYANLTRADLTKANLTNAVLHGTDLSKADLTEADLTWADLSAANLTDAKLSRANLSGADLTGANLSGADLTETNLTGVKLKLLKADHCTIWKGVVKHDKEDRRPIWAIIEDEDGTKHTVDSWEELFTFSIS